MVAAVDAGRARTKPFVRHRTRRALLFWCFLAPSLLIFLLYRIIPVVWNLVLSFQYWSPLKAADVLRQGRVPTVAPGRRRRFRSRRRPLASRSPDQDGGARSYSGAGRCAINFDRCSTVW